MSPSSYLLVRNISKVFEMLDFCKYSIEKWYKIINDKKRVRLVQLHNNLSYDHFIKNKYSYFISWGSSRRDIPIYDLIYLFNLYYYDVDFLDILNVYQKNYSLLEEEKILFLILICLPNKIIFSDNEYDDCLKVKKFYDRLNAASLLIDEYNKKKKVSVK